jgi:hypothetical protein
MLQGLFALPQFREAMEAVMAVHDEEDVLFKSKSNRTLHSAYQLIY